MARRRTCQIGLALLALFLLGTVVVLSTVSFYLKINPAAYLSREEVAAAQQRNASERIPRILHQTWKSDVLPERWQNVSDHCREIMPDYEYKLWTDADSREFVAEHYNWFLTTFDAYKYPIQRADAIRYFVLHYFGGVYLDLDVGCTKPLDPLLSYPVVLPKTIPVGVSNDLMFAERAHPFMEQTIHNLVTFDHSWMLNYPTVMFSTGPMFLSAQYGLFAAAHPLEVRILPKSLYGKNAKPDEAPDPYFTHYYGSSWHADDAGFITFLGKRGKLLMWIGLAVLILGLARLLWVRKKSSQSSSRRRLFGSYDIYLPRVSHRDGQFHFDIGYFSLSAQPSSPTYSSAPSPNNSPPPSDSELPLLPLYDDHDTNYVRSNNSSHSANRMLSQSNAARAFRGVSSWVRSTLGRRRTIDDQSNPRRRRRSTLFFLPAIFTPSSSPRIRIHEGASRDLSPPPSRRSSSSRSISWIEQPPGDCTKGSAGNVDFRAEDGVGDGSGCGDLSIDSTAILSRTNSSRILPQIAIPTDPPSYEINTRNHSTTWSATWNDWGLDDQAPRPKHFA